MRKCFHTKTTAAWLPFFFLFFGISLITFALRGNAFELNGQRQQNEQFQQGSVLIGKVIPGSLVIYKNRKLSLTSDGHFVLGVGRDAPSSIELQVTEQNQVKVFHIPIKSRAYNIQKVDGVPQETVEPSPEQIARINREGALVSIARKVDLQSDFFLEKFIWPITGPISGVYGSQRIYNGVPKTPHMGVDIARPTGSSVVAPAGGKVTLAYGDMFLSGGTLIIDHGHGLSSTFIHLSKILVKEGDTINQGQEIALVGQTGRATGPHLHWAMNWFEEKVDPALLVPGMKE